MFVVFQHSCFRPLITHYRKPNMKARVRLLSPNSFLKVSLMTVPATRDNLSSDIVTEDGDISDDDDVEVGGATQNYICPLSLTVFVKPVTSYVCLLLAPSLNLAEISHLP